MRVIYDEKNKQWGSLDQQTPKGGNVMLGQRILKSLTAYGSKVSQINDDTGVQMTYHDVWLETVRAAQNLQKRGYQPHQVFGFMAANSDHLISIVLASICLACPIAPLHAMLTKKEICRVLAKTKPTVMFCDISAYDQLHEALEELGLNIEVFTFDGKIDGSESVEDLLVETGDEDKFVPVDFDDENNIAGIFCSSGTTGPSKCAYIPYDNEIFAPAIFRPNCVVLSFESIYWTAAVPPMVGGVQVDGITRIITAKSFSPELQLNLIEKYKINVLCNTPFSLVACLKNVDLSKKTEFPSVRSIVLYGNKVPCNLVAEALRCFPNAIVTSLYAMTEIGGVSFSILDAHTPTNIGHLYPRTIAKIVDEDGNRCGPNVSGELCIKKEKLFYGYLDDPEENAAAVDDEGFFRTGDTGHFDVNGTLVFGDRLKNILRIYYFRAVLIASEIEDFLLKMPDVLEVSVIGIPIAGGSGLPAAVIVRKPNSNLTQQDVYNAVAEKFPIRSRLRGGVYFVNKLPKTHSGKQIRKDITEFTVKMFNLRKDDSEIQSYISDIPEEFRKLI